LDCGSDASSFRFGVGKRIRELAVLRSSETRFAEEKRKLIGLRFRSPKCRRNPMPPCTGRMTDGVRRFESVGHRFTSVGHRFALVDDRIVHQSDAEGASGRFASDFGQGIRQIGRE
jgi:hypothetical protein